MKKNFIDDKYFWISTFNTFIKKSLYVFCR